MEVTEAIRVRRSVRSFSDREIPEEVLMKILEAGRVSPSASNMQPWHFIVVKDAARREALSKGRYAKFLSDCPVVIVGCGNKVASSKWYRVDLSIALEDMVLEATSEGVGTCWIGSFDGDSVKEVLKIPDDFEVVAMIAVGYPKENVARRSSRKSLAEISSWEEFGRPKPG